MRIHKNWLGILAFAAWSVTACNPTEQKTILIKNPTAVHRAEVASVPYTEFKQAHASQGSFQLVDDQGKVYAYQLEKAGADSVQNLLIWADVPANGELKLHVEAADTNGVDAKTYARYIPERFDDFAWENDKIAFRMYGKALEGRPDDAQGLDIWAKRTDQLVIDQWYKTGDYHKDHGQGLDYYSVGMTLGAGDIAPVVDGQIVYSKHYRGHEVLDNGPLRSTFRLTYEPWEVNGKNVSVTKTITLDAGSQLNKVEAVYHYEGTEKLPVAAGIVLRKEDGGKIMKLANQQIIGYWEPQHGQDGTLGIAIIGKSPITGVTEIAGQLLAQFKALADQPLVYYNGGAWNKAGEITSADAWEKYLLRYQERIQHPLEVSIK